MFLYCCKEQNSLKAMTKKGNLAQYLSEKFYGGKGSDVAKFSLHRPMLPSHEELILRRQVPKSDSYENFSVYTLSESLKSWTSIPTMSNISGDTSSRTAFDWGASRLTDCVKSHGCGQSVPNTKLPTRILDLSPPESNDVQKLRLYEPDQEYAPYACLSHCWGPPDLQPVRLTKSEISGYKENINLDSLPNTFREAIQFGSALTISAVVSSNCSEGCYRKAPVESCGSRPLLHTPFDIKGRSHVWGREDRRYGLVSSNHSIRNVTL
ncbi:HET domain containing protein [Hyaloscypha variabilis]